MKKNVLVFPCGSEIGLEVYNSVKYSAHFHLIGASSVDDHGKFVFEDYISGVPFITDDAIIPFLKRIIKERNIEAIYPTMDLVITKLKEYEDELGCKVISSPLETTQISLSKKKTYDMLKNVILTPKMYDISSVESYPVFIKPEIGYGAKGTKKVNDSKELSSFMRDNPDSLIVEYLSGEEYTIDCFTDRKGNLLYSAARRRNRIRNGISVNTTLVEKQDEFRDFVEKINSIIKFRGAWFAQVKRNSENELCLLEVASRFGGSSSLSRALGVNFALLSLFDAFDYDVDILINNYYVELDRALDCKYKCNLTYDTVYVDYDDCLILDKREINTELVEFLYGCINKDKKIILLSKHDGNLHLELKSFRLDSLFDEVIHISKDEKKCNYIEDKNSIFIDDSFAERECIRTEVGIPVFSPDMVMCL